MSEKWLAVRGFEGAYEVSDQGRVRSLKSGRALIMRSQGSTDLGHQKLDLRADGRRFPRWVHRLVLEAFVGPCSPGHQVRHLDGDPTNNALGNLAYGTPSDNMRDAVAHGTHAEASRTHCDKGHPFSPENTTVTPTRRICRTCQSARRSKWSAKTVECEACGKSLQRGSLKLHRRHFCPSGGLNATKEK